MAGLVSWGLGCHKKETPGVYADITQGLCFIHWDTQCKHNDKYQQYYDYPQCKNWLEDLIVKYVVFDIYIFFTSSKNLMQFSFQIGRKL